MPLDWDFIVGTTEVKVNDKGGAPSEGAQKNKPDFGQS